MTQSQQNVMITDFSRSFAMDNPNTKILLQRMKSSLSEEATPISKQVIKTLHAKWFVEKFGMNYINTELAINSCTEIFGEPVGNEPARVIIEASYVDWFANEFGMNEANTLILKDRYSQLFKEKLDNIYRNNMSALKEGKTNSNSSNFDVSLKLITSELDKASNEADHDAVVSAASMINRCIGSNSHTDTIEKQFNGLFKKAAKDWGSLVKTAHHLAVATTSSIPEKREKSVKWLARESSSDSADSVDSLVPVTATPVVPVSVTTPAPALVSEIKTTELPVAKIESVVVAEAPASTPPADTVTATPEPIIEAKEELSESSLNIESPANKSSTSPDINDLFLSRVVKYVDEHGELPPKLSSINKLIEIITASNDVLLLDKFLKLGNHDFNVALIEKLANLPQNQGKDYFKEITSKCFPKHSNEDKFLNVVQDHDHSTSGNEAEFLACLIESTPLNEDIIQSIIGEFLIHDITETPS